MLTWTMGLMSGAWPRCAGASNGPPTPMRVIHQLPYPSLQSPVRIQSSDDSLPCNCKHEMQELDRALQSSYTKSCVRGFLQLRQRNMLTQMKGLKAAQLSVRSGLKGVDLTVHDVSVTQLELQVRWQGLTEALHEGVAGTLRRAAGGVCE